MGTRLGMHLEGAPRNRLMAVAARMLAEVERIEAACSIWREDSEWSRLNRAQGVPVPMAAEWLDLLGKIPGWHAWSLGAFDPVILPLVKEDRAGAEAFAASGFGLLRLDGAAGTARLDHPRAGVDGGGFVKGYALDAALAFAEGAPWGWLDFGGQIMTWGQGREVAVAGPRGRRASPLRILLPARSSLACSGCSERGRHLLDPRTGTPCPDWGSVAAAAGTGLEAELLSTALFVLGPEAGLPWAAEQKAAAAFLLHDGRVERTPAFRALEVP